MRIRAHSHVVHILVAMLLIGAALPVHAQDGQPDDSTALIDRVITAAQALDEYAGLEIMSHYTTDQRWTGTLSGQVVAGQDESFNRTVQSAVNAADGDLNVRQQIGIHDIWSSVESPDPREMALEAETRVVDGAVYVTAAYIASAENALALPDDWIRYSGPATLQLWPGLQVLGLSQLVDTLGQPFSHQVFNLDIAQARQLLVDKAISVTAEDGLEGQVITIDLAPDAAPALGLISLEDLVTKHIYENRDEGHLAFSFTLSPDSGALVALHVLFAFDAASVDMTGIPGVPAGLMLAVHSTTDYLVQLSPDVIPLEPVEAPLITVAGLPAFETPVVNSPMFWWNDRVFYEVFVRSFYDSDGDGIGDLRGLIDKLDYLNDGDPATTADLGVTGLWLMPVAESPSYHGYDVTDYYTIESDYGTNQDFLDLMDAAHARGMVVIVDLVMNHTSNQHPWFVAASEGDPAYEDWYIWSDNLPQDLSPWGSQVWHQAGDRYYFGLFWEGMPDLNYENPAVTAQMYNIIDYWLTDMGVDGFRLDAIRHLIEDGPVMENTPATLAWLHGFHDYVRSINPDALTVGEVWSSSDIVAQYIGDKVDLAFEFDFAQAILFSAQYGVNDLLVSGQNDLLELYPTGQYATFLTNHDQNRVMSQLASDSGAARVAATILLTSPGVPFVYYGEEIGMVGEKPDERIRTPMQWDSTRINGGFSSVSPWEMLPTGYRTVNVASQTDDPASLLSHYRRLIHLRDEHAALRTGTIQLVASSDGGVYSFLRYGDDETLLVVVNLSRETVDGYTLSADYTLLGPVTHADLLLGDGDASAPSVDESGGFAGYVPLPSLPPQSSFVISLH